LKSHVTTKTSNTGGGKDQVSYKSGSYVIKLGGEIKTNTGIEVTREHHDKLKEEQKRDSSSELADIKPRMSFS